MQYSLSNQTHFVCYSEYYIKLLLGNKDPCIDDTTPFYEHHILGTLEEFREQNEKNLQSKVKLCILADL